MHLEVAHDPDSLAPYFVEEIRRYLEGKYGSDQVHKGGLRVYTSLDMDLQRAANRAVLDGLAAYERRHGWRGSCKMFSGEVTLANYQDPDWDSEPEVNGYIHALVMAVTPARRPSNSDITPPRSRPPTLPGLTASCWTS